MLPQGVQICSLIRFILAHGRFRHDDLVEPPHSGTRLRGLPRRGELVCNWPRVVRIWIKWQYGHQLTTLEGDMALRDFQYPRR